MDRSGSDRSSASSASFVRFFFFQAEDGIRDGTVTGVQTCALPIYRARAGLPSSRASGSSPTPLGRARNMVSLGDAARDGRALVHVQACAVLDRHRLEPRDRKSTRLELQSQFHLVCRLLLEKKKNNITINHHFLKNRLHQSLHCTCSLYYLHTNSLHINIIRLTCS